MLALVDIAAFGLTIATAVRRHLHRPPTVQALFLDCDDCLYQNNWATAEKITAAIAAYTNKIGVSRDEAYALYKKHGTCLKGLLVEGRIGQAGVETFLREAHDIDYSDIDADSKLRSVLAELTAPYWVFTASTTGMVARPFVSPWNDASTYLLPSRPSTATASRSPGDTGASPGSSSTALAVHSEKTPLNLALKVRLGSCESQNHGRRIN